MSEPKLINYFLYNAEHQQYNKQYLDKNKKIKIMWENLLTQSLYKHYIDRGFDLDLGIPVPPQKMYGPEIPNAGGKGPSVTGPYGSPERAGPLSELSMFVNIQMVIHKKYPSNSVNVEEIAKEYSAKTIPFPENCENDVKNFINRLINLTNS